MNRVKSRLFEFKVIIVVLDILLVFVLWWYLMLGIVLHSISVLLNVMMCFILLFMLYLLLFVLNVYTAALNTNNCKELWS